MSVGFARFGMACGVAFAGVLGTAWVDAPLAAAQEVRADVTVQVPAAPPVVVEPTPVAPPVAAIPAAPEGQWVLTKQYGWVYMPYAEQYTFVPPRGHAQMYVFYPRTGWRWVKAPWVLGAGPVPHWGPAGYARFSWHARPWFQRPLVDRRGRPVYYR